MARSLQKVTKAISKKRGGKGKTNSLHQNSRDAQRLRRAGAREDKLARLLDAATRNNQLYVDRVAWFKSAIESSSGAVSEDELRLLTEVFIAREDEQLAELQQERAKRAAKAEERIVDRRDAETREFKAGFWVPDLRDEEGRARLERWAGEWSGLNTLKFVRVVKGGAVKPSSFPPKGLS
ncbi:hypothetical protein DV735_g2775, partial [Chaetothyriales sp. CBS 134920]